MLFVVLAVITAASTLTAQDTLRIQSYRIVDVCSAERRWLLAVNVGTIRPTDSLVSFDITIGYNKNKLLPTDVLKEGTLSANMGYPPVLNTVVPNEMRISGGNIIKPVAGDLPLFAVSGEFLGSCNEITALSYPWPATFNEEFKKRFTVVGLDSVKSLALAKKYVGLGYTASADTMRLDKDSTSATDITLKGDLSIDSVFVLKVLFNTQAIACQIDPAFGVQVVSSDTMTNGIAWTLRHQNAARHLKFRTKWNDTSSDTTSLIRISTQTTQTCACVAPAEIDSIVVLKTVPVVSVSSFDEHVDGIRFANENLSIQCDHEKMKSVTIFSLSGENLVNAVLPIGQASVSLSSLPRGPYIVRVSCGFNNLVKLILK